MRNLCCCSISTQEQNFWKKVFFGLTKVGKNNALEIDDDKQLEIIDADKLPFEITVGEFDFVEQLEIEDDKDAEFDSENQKGSLEIENEMTIKLKKMGCTFYEVPFSYYGRPFNEGKKIRPSDGFKAMYYILYYWIISLFMKSNA